jgi:hypothetical protein
MREVMEDPGKTKSYNAQQRFFPVSAAKAD